MICKIQEFDSPAFESLDEFQHSDFSGDYGQQFNRLLVQRDIELEREADYSTRILLLAGGHGYGGTIRTRKGIESVVPNRQAGGMAGRVARYILNKSGAELNDASLCDAAASAASAMFQLWFYRCQDECEGGEGFGWEHWRPIIAAIGWRAARNSITDDGRQGRTGEKSDYRSRGVAFNPNRFDGDFEPIGDTANDIPVKVLLSADECKQSVLSLTSFFESGGGFNAPLIDEEEELKNQVSTMADKVPCVAWLEGVEFDGAGKRAERKRAFHFITSALGAPAGNPLAPDYLIQGIVGGRSGLASRMRARLICWLIVGAPCCGKGTDSWQRGANFAGFTSRDSAVESIRSGGVWDTLRAAALNHTTPAEQVAKQRLARLAKVHAAAWRLYRSCPILKATDSVIEGKRCAFANWRKAWKQVKALRAQRGQQFARVATGLRTGTGKGKGKLVAVQGKTGVGKLA